MQCASVRRLSTVISVVSGRHGLSRCISIRQCHYLLVNSIPARVHCHIFSSRHSVKSLTYSLESKERTDRHWRPWWLFLAYLAVPHGLDLGNPTGHAVVFTTGVDGGLAPARLTAQQHKYILVKGRDSCPHPCVEVMRIRERDRLSVGLCGNKNAIREHVRWFAEISRTDCHLKSRFKKAVPPKP
ncbi:hypothetical protein BDW42DRAFT_119489 [Aspergillus taichungensis]|uniref:Uncharacterized protein n=1 Tax=Aspergillus taichungensis TaxID=482145 RepID=A0A2J5HRM9_9EURO|nr:hypothetical protein BDW42DRAFT_119489 [Aspergillus taichungensis]